LDDLQIALKPALGAAFSDSSKIFCQEMTRFHDEDTKLKEEVVLLGGHFDSWHSGTGATDNAAGCVVMMEALRILKIIGIKPRRTIRMALWDGEEGGLLGSGTYVKNHFGDPATMQLKPEYEKLAGYFNLDNGTGKIRGVYLQGNEAVRPIFASWLQPFHYLGATTLAIQSVGGTDHLSFDHIGLPGFQFIQDPIDYETRTHHTNLDVYESVLPDDLKQAAVIVASFVYHTAMRDEKLPRKALPKPSR
jgi:Zn-dependent M28 family amino/carboxypeptidase